MRRRAEAAARLLRPLTVEEAREVVQRALRESFERGLGLDADDLRRRLLDRLGATPRGVLDRAARSM